MSQSAQVNNSLKDDVLVMLMKVSSNFLCSSAS